MNASASGTPACDPWLSYPVEITGLREETPGVATYNLQFHDKNVAETYRFRPGQFNMLYLPGIGEAAISISSDPERNDGLLHTIRTAGNVTRALARLGEGGSLGLRGPFGSSWPLDDYAGWDLVIVAGGIGLAPLRPVIYRALAERDTFGRITLLCGARSPENLLYQQEYESWKQRGAIVDVTVDRSVPGWQGHVGVVPLLLDRVRLERPEKTAVFICGPEVMMWYTARSAREKGIAAGSIWINMERNMNCAVGLCGHCQFGPAFICKDGPILRFDTLAPFLRVKDL